MYPNSTCKISNYLVEPDYGFFNLFLSPEFQEETGIKRCLATTHKISEIISYVENKQGDIHDTDILIEFDNTSSLVYNFVIVNNNFNEAYVLFELNGQERTLIDEDNDIDNLVNRHKEKNLILQF